MVSTNQTHRGPFYYTDDTPSDLAGLITMAEWPQYDIVRSYAARGTLFYRVNLNSIQVGRTWNVPFTWIANLHREETWKDSQKMSMTMPCHTGLRFGPYMEPVDILDTTTAIPKGFLLHPEGLLYGTKDGIESVNAVIPRNWDDEMETDEEDGTNGDDASREDAEAEIGVLQTVLQKS